VPSRPLHAKTNFLNRINVIWVVQLESEKYFALPGPQISGFLLPSRTHKRGASRSSRVLGAGCDGRGMSRDERHDADGEVVWSWRPKAGATLCGMTRSNGDNKAWSPGRARISRKTIRAGKAGCSGCTCGSAACFFVARGPWVSADTRPSLRPLKFSRAIQMRSSDALRRENAGSCPLRCFANSIERRKTGWGTRRDPGHRVVSGGIFMGLDARPRVMVNRVLTSPYLW
jgi:hypothetical protein